MGADVKSLRTKLSKDIAEGVCSASSLTQIQCTLFSSSVLCWSTLYRSGSNKGTLLHLQGIRKKNTRFTALR